MADPDESDWFFLNDRPKKKKPDRSDSTSRAGDDLDSALLRAASDAFEKAAKSVVDASIAVKLEAVLSGHLKALDEAFDAPDAEPAIETGELRALAEPVDPYAPSRRSRSDERSDALGGDGEEPGADAADEASLDDPDFYGLLAEDIGYEPELDGDELIDGPVPHVLGDAGEPDAAADETVRSGKPSAALRRRAAGIAYWGRFGREAGMSTDRSAPRPLLLLIPLLVGGLSGALVLGLAEGVMPSAPISARDDSGRSPAYEGLLAARTPPPGESTPGPLLPAPEPVEAVDLSQVVAAYPPERPVESAMTPRSSAAAEPADLAEASAPPPVETGVSPDTTASVSLETDLRPTVAPEGPAEVVAAAADGPADSADPDKPVEPELGVMPDLAAMPPYPSDQPLAYGPSEDLLANEIVEAVLADPQPVQEPTEPEAETVAAVPPPARSTPTRSDSSTAAVGTGVAVTNADVNLRSGPDNGNASVVVVPRGGRVQVVGCKVWCEVSYEGKRGYIFPKFLEQR